LVSFASLFEFYEPVAPGALEDAVPDFGAGGFVAFASGLELLDSDFVGEASDFVAEVESADEVDDTPDESFDFSARLSLR